MADYKVLLEKDGQFELVSASDMTSTSMDFLNQPKELVKNSEPQKTDTESGQVTQDKTFEKSEHNMIVLSEEREPTKGGHLQKPDTSFQVRSVSAPAKDQIGLESDNMNQTAFQAWLQHKNDQLRERRKIERLKQTSTNKQRPTDLECEKAFQAWLANKKRQHSAIAHSKEQESESKEARKRRNDLAFEAWIKKKQTERLQSLKYEKQRLKDLEEAAKLADPEMCQRAYKQ